MSQAKEYLQYLVVLIDIPSPCAFPSPSLLSSLITLAPNARILLFLGLQTPTLPQHIQVLFDAMDDNKDGTLDGKEIDKVIETLQVGESFLILPVSHVCMWRFICMCNECIERLRSSLWLSIYFNRFIRECLCNKWGSFLACGEEYRSNRSQYTSHTP